MKGKDKLGRFIKGFSSGPRTLEVKRKISLANSGKNNGQWNGGKSLGACRICRKKFYYYPRQQKGYYCSVKCANKNINPIWLFTPERIKRSTENLLKNIKKGKECWNWKGNKVGYVSLHTWVNRKLGQPNKCDNCGTSEIRRYHWANISGEYKRNLKDWQRLCVPCHNKLDNISQKVWTKRRMKLNI